MNISLNLQIDYTINKIFTNKQFDYIVYRFNLKNITLVKVMLTKHDIITTLPYFESINLDYFSIINTNIISAIIIEIYEKLGIEINREDFIKENVGMLENFISELKTNVKDVQAMLIETNKKKNL